MRTIVIFFLSLFFIKANAQIEGLVTDEKTKETLVGAVVLLTGSSEIRATLTGLDGSFIFNQVDTGSYSIDITYASYDDKSINTH